MIINPIMRTVGNGLWCDEKGQTTVEYVAGLLFFGVVIAFLLNVFFGSLDGLFDSLSQYIAKPYP